MEQTFFPTYLDMVSKKCFTEHGSQFRYINRAIDFYLDDIEKQRAGDPNFVRSFFFRHNFHI